MSKLVEIDNMARLRHHLLEAEKWQLIMERIEVDMYPQVAAKLGEQTGAGTLPKYMVREQVYATNPDHVHAKAMRNWHQSQVMLYAQVVTALSIVELLTRMSGAAPMIPQQR